MGIRLTAEEMLEVFGEHDPTEHAAEAEERWGDTDAYRESQRRTSTYSKDDWVRIRTEEQGVRDAFAAAMAAGLPPTSDQARAAAAAHHEHITRWYYEVTPEIHQGLGEMYVADPRFTEHYDATAPGLAAYVRDAIVGLYSSSSGS